MRTKLLIAYFVILIILCAAVIGGARMLGKQGAYLAQLYMLTPALAALLVRIFIYQPRFQDANLHLGKPADYLRFWLLALVLVALYAATYTVLGAVAWDFSGTVFLGRLAEQFAAAGQDMASSLPPGFTPELMLILYFVGGLTIFNIPGIITGFGEEFGHRGFMFPLLYRIKPWIGIIVGGLIWYIWHIPLMLVIPQTSNDIQTWQRILDFIVLAAGSICTYIYLSYVYIKTESVFVTSIAHIAINNAAMSLSYFMILHSQLLADIGTTLVMLLIVLILYLRKDLEIFQRYFRTSYPPNN
jgi:membrane protease YdiL (CAAX protease family)